MKLKKKQKIIKKEPKKFYYMIKKHWILKDKIK